MPKKRKEKVEFRFYDIPKAEKALVLMGDEWVRVYGHEASNLHFHNLMEVGICRKGSGKILFDGESKHYRTGDVTIIPENHPHSTYSDGEEANAWEFIYIDIKREIEELYANDPSFCYEAVQSINKMPMLLRNEDAEALTRIITCIVEEKRAQRPFFGDIMKLFVHALVTEIMRLSVEGKRLNVTPTTSTNMPCISTALTYINENYAEELRVREIATICGLSETHFRRVFEEYVKMPPMEYVNLVRVQKACELMSKSSDSMDVVAKKCGFVTISTFNRNFKKFLKTSPYQWKINPENLERRLTQFQITALRGW